MFGYMPIKQSYDTHEPVSGADSSLSPIIFVHGFGASKEDWKDIPKIISNQTGRVAYNIDIRNHGDTEWSDEFDFDVLLQDILHFMELIKSDKAIFICHSLGARLAINFTIENPDKVEMIIVEEMMIRKPKSHLYGFPFAFTTIAPKVLPNILKGTSEDEAAKFILKTVCKSLPPENVKKYRLEEIDKTAVALKRTKDVGFTFKTNLKVMKRFFTSVNEILEPFGYYNGPAFFIYGKASAYEISKEIDHIKKRFPKAEFLGIEDACHHVHHDKPKEFTDNVLKFILKQQ